MNEDQDIPSPAPTDLPTFRVLSEGKDVGDLYRICSVVVSREFNKISRARIVLFDGDPSKEDFEVSNTDDFIPGKEIEIFAGYHSNDDSIFKGIIIGHGIRSRKNNASTLIIECRDIAVKMTSGKKSSYFYDVSDLEIAEQLVTASGAEFKGDATSTKHKEMVQYNCTDWDFLLSCAERSGRLIHTNDGTIYFIQPKTNGGPKLSLAYGTTMLEFEADADARNQFQSIKTNSWDPSAQSMSNAEAEIPSSDELGNFEAKKLATIIGADESVLLHSGIIGDKERQSLADAFMQNNRLSKVRGRVKCQGFAAIRPSDMLELNGVGDRFNGNAFVSGVRHQITIKNWETDIQFGLSPDCFVSIKNANTNSSNGIPPIIGGMQIGIVVQLENDPQGEERVQVRVPSISGKEAGVWARLASADAGNKRGMVFRPEINDEVVLGFFNDDPRCPVILGMLNSSSKPSPVPASDKNNLKGFQTRSGLKFLFDDEKTEVQIQTPNGNKFTVSDKTGGVLVEDENKNKIEINSDGITIKSASDLNIKATGDINIEGVNLNFKASAELKAEGSAGAEFKSGAIAVLKGSLVQIN
jgi:Rhs element Vgr protein